MKTIQIGLVGIRKANNQGLFTTTGGNDLLHILPVATTANSAPRSCYIRKIMVYNNTGADRTLRFGTLDRNPAGVAFVPLLPTLVVINTFDQEWAEEEIPNVEFISWRALTVAGRTGDIYVVASAAGVLVSLEVEEFGA